MTCGALSCEPRDEIAWGRLSQEEPVCGAGGSESSGGGNCSESRAVHTQGGGGAGRGY